jgi:prevent-host-death family protein
MTMVRSFYPAGGSAFHAMAATISASQFKARCLGLMDQVAATGEVLVITKNGQPVAELHPCASARRPSPLGLHPTVEIHGDLLAPIDSPWAALE